MAAVPAEPVADLLHDPTAAYRVVSSRDARWDGRLFLGVVSTGVYCRPSCPARTPRPENCRYYACAAAAVAAGFRACRRCRPDALPASRADDHRSDLAARALRLIRDGAVDEHGVGGVAAALHVSERHLHRVLVEEVGVGPLRLAQSRRAQLARLLVEQSELGMTAVAFAAGFSSVRQFNDVMRAEFGRPPSQLRTGTGGTDRRPRSGGPTLTLRLRYRDPYAVDAVWGFLGARLVPGVEWTHPDGSLVRTVGAVGGPARVCVGRPSGGLVAVRLDLAELSDLAALVHTVRRWLDLDADPSAVDRVLGADRGLRRLVRRTPGIRVPGAISGFEMAVRAVVGQQVSVAAARTVLGRLAADLGEQGVFPGATQVAAGGETALRGIGLTGRRARAVLALAQDAASGRLVLDPGADRDATRRHLRALPGVGAWTVEYVALRALGDPDAWPEGDLVLRRRVRDARLDPARWRPWRGYGAMHLWTATPSAANDAPTPSTEESR
jgi:AraC family transcriptional regulator of adaptative response / DNA-3-methyladenine glycosylase II